MAKTIYFLLRGPQLQEEQEINPTPMNQIEEMASLRDIILSVQMPWSSGVELTSNVGGFGSNSNIYLGI